MKLKLLNSKKFQMLTPPPPLPKLYPSSLLPRGVIAQYLKCSVIITGNKNNLFARREYNWTRKIYIQMTQVDRDCQSFIAAE